MTEKWFFTFMTKQTLLKNKIIIFEGDICETRNEMVKNFGAKWAFQYEIEKLGNVLESYQHISEIQICHACDTKGGENIHDIHDVIREDKNKWICRDCETKKESE